jgi:hypothetical protein
MEFIKYYWGLIRFAVEGAWGFSQLFAAILALAGGYVAYRHPEWGATVNNLLWIVPCVIFVVLFVIRLILAPYEKDKQRQQEISKLIGNNKNIKQQIRNFLESIAPNILQKIDAKEKEIGISIDIPNQVELMRLSKLPDFDKYLAFKEYQFGDYMLNCTPFKGYILYPKDEIIK